MRMRRSGVTPRTAPRIRLSRFTIDTHMKLFFAGATHAGQSHVREEIRVTLLTPKLQIIYNEQIIFNIS
jgi:hypothetical protein